MRRIVGITLIFLFVFSGVGLAAKVFVDYDPKADFGKYKTFAWVENDGLNLASVNELLHLRVKNYIEAKFIQAGFHLLPSCQQAFTLDIFLNLFDQVRTFFRFAQHRCLGRFHGSFFRSRADERKIIMHHHPAFTQHRGRQLFHKQFTCFLILNDLEHSPPP